MSAEHKPPPDIGRVGGRDILRLRSGREIDLRWTKHARTIKLVAVLKMVGFAPRGQSFSPHKIFLSAILWAEIWFMVDSL